MESPTDWHQERRPPAGADGWDNLMAERHLSEAAAHGSQHLMAERRPPEAAASTREEAHRPPHGGVVHAEEYPLPGAYGQDQLTLLVRDPQCVFAFWEVTPEGWDAAVRRLPGSGPPAPVLRVYDLGGCPHLAAHWRREDARGRAEFHVAGASSWYVHTRTPGLVLAAEIGARRGEAFVAIARSRAVATPPGRPSDDVDADWMTIEDIYRLVPRAVGTGGSPEFQTEWSRRRRLAVSRGPGLEAVDIGFSPGFMAGFSPGLTGQFSPGLTGGHGPGLMAGFRPISTAGFSPNPAAGVSPASTAGGKML